MCSIEPRLGTDQAASRFTMIDSSSPQPSSGLATALRDRSTCKIPNQPNRSLPVRPAPHTPCRSLPPRRAPPPQPIQPPKSSTAETPSSSIATSSNQEENHSSPSLGIIRIGVQNWQHDIRQPYINIINLSTTLDKPLDSAPHRGTKRSAPESENNVSTSNSTVIDISHSPDRSESSKLDSPASSSSTEPSKAPTPDQDPASKKKRRKRLKKDDDKIEINLEQPSKIVPPLRLKKIQTLQEDVTSVASTWGNLKKPEPQQDPIPGFRFYQPRQQEPEIVDDSSKYRIVSGTTPPYDESVDSSTVPSGDDQKDDKLRFKQNKLKVKLRELKRKTVELGREMLRTALTSPENSVQETIDSYEEQIEKLTNLLKKLPEAASSINANDHLEELLPSIVTSTISSQAKSMPIITDVSSQEPPKLSPKGQSDHQIIFDHQDQDIRESPPVLTKATLHGEDTEDTWQEFEGLRGLLKISRKGKDRKDDDKSADVTTTVDSIHEEIDLDNKSDILETGEMPKTEIKVGEVKTIEIRTLGEVQEVMKIDLRDSPSLGEMIIDTTSVLQEFEKRSEPNDNAIETVNLAANLSVGGSEGSARITTPVPIISSSCEENKNLGNKEMMIGDQFPSLGNWLARMSAKIPNELSVSQAEEKKEQIVIESRSPAFQGNIQTYSQGKTQAIEISSNGGVEAGRGWREERWKGQERIQQNTGVYANGGVGVGGSQMVNQTGQQMGQEYCQPPMSIGRYYPRNYPVDPYGIPYGYNHPAIAASLWSGAILQYPYLRPRGLPPGFQQRLPTNSLQYNLCPVPGPRDMGPVPGPRAPPPPYPLGNAAQLPQDVSRLPENQRSTSGTYDSSVITSKRNDQLVSSHQTVVDINNQRIQQSRDQFGRVYTDSRTRTPISDAQRDQIYRQSWRGPMLPQGPIAARNYPINANWTSDPCSLLAALTPSALQNYSTPVSMVQRNRNNKESIELVRNCETPHLGKVNYSPNTAKTLECSNCSSTGPLFKCLGCEVAFYCDETCQSRHWTRHVISCPKKMPKLKKVVP